MNRAIRLLGLCVAVAAGTYFVVHLRSALGHQDVARLLRPEVIVAALALTLLYALLVPITALAWTWLLRGLGTAATFAVAAPVLATTQFGKYLPGNVAQHLGRVAVSRAHGMQPAPTIISMLYETLLVAVACAHISALVFVWEPPPTAMAHWPLMSHRSILVAAFTAGALLLIAAAPWLTARLARWRVADSPGPRPSPRLPARALGTCYLLYVLNFVLVGIGLDIVALALASGQESPGLLYCIGAFASSWILGFLAPGAPAGLGVREAALFLWLGARLPAGDAVALVLALRIATTLGDLITFAWGSILLTRLDRRRRSAAASDSA